MIGASWRVDRISLSVFNTIATRPCSICWNWTQCCARAVLAHDPLSLSAWGRFSHKSPCTNYDSQEVVFVKCNAVLGPCSHFTPPQAAERQGKGDSGIVIKYWRKGFVIAARAPQTWGIPDWARPVIGVNMINEAHAGAISAWCLSNGINMFEDYVAVAIV